MKLKELRSLINSISAELDECEVILQKDPEGNGYSPLSGVDEDTIYISESESSGKVYDYYSEADDNCMGVDEWEELKNDPTKRCITLYP